MAEIERENIFVQAVEGRSQKAREGTGREGIILKWEGTFEEAKRNNIVRLAMNFGATEIRLKGLRLGGE